MNPKQPAGFPALDAMAASHNRLRRLVRGAIKDVENTDLLSPALVAPLVQYLLAHFRLEETEIFPLAESAAGDPRIRPTVSLRREHQVLRELLRDIEAALTRRDRSAARGDLLELAASQRLHCDKEDALYPQALEPDKSQGT